MAEMSVKPVDIIRDLLTNNICKHCCLRYLNVKNPDAYNDVKKYMISILCEADYEECISLLKEKDQNPCSACLGLLQLSGNNEFLEKIAEDVSNAAYDSDDMAFALSLPITILLRDYSVWLYVSNKYSAYYVDPFSSSCIRRPNNIVSIKEAWKWLAGRKICEKMNKTLNNGVDGHFHVNIHIEYENDNAETYCLLEMFPDVFKCRTAQKRKFHGEILTRKSVENSLPEVDLIFFKKFYPVPPKMPIHFVKCGNVECIQDSIFLGGRYNKYSRNLSQTPWVINGERRMESSVEEIIGNPVSKLIKNNGIKFSSSGREDVDVRTLGRGRPFVLEVINPRRTKFDFEAMRLLENEINNSTKDVFVRDLQLVAKEDLGHIKMGEQSKTKTYSCFCITQMADNETIDEFKKKLKDLENIKNLVIQQKTPIRVLHRRSLAIRPRTVFWMEAEFHEVKDCQIFFKLSLEVEAGTYIKEFVHGDFGRTKPNLSEILQKETDILALDVEEVALQWPPNIQQNERCET